MKQRFLLTALVLLISQDISRLFLNSGIIALSVSFFSVVFGAYAAYPIARLNFRGRYTLLFSILVVRLVPALALAIPIVLFAKQMGMNDNLVTLIFINMSFVLPYSIWLLQAYFKTIPTELEDAARMDGCNRFQVANKIIIPLSIPGMTTAGILAFLLSWGNSSCSVDYRDRTVLHEYRGRRHVCQ